MIETETVQDKMKRIVHLKNLEAKYDSIIKELNQHQERHLLLKSSSIDYYKDTARVLHLDVTGVKTMLDYGFRAKEEVLKGEIAKIEKDILEFKF